jgi:hypothetical protein
MAIFSTSAYTVRKESSPSARRAGHSLERSPGVALASGMHAKVTPAKNRRFTWQGRASLPAATTSWCTKQMCITTWCSIIQVKWLVDFATQELIAWLTERQPSKFALCVISETCRFIFEPEYTITLREKVGKGLQKASTGQERRLHRQLEAMPSSLA